MIVDIFLLAIGFTLLIAGAGKLIDGSSAIARKFNIPDIVIGLTIVSLGTSAPEMVVNILASVKNEPAMVLGNVLGSNIFNVLMVLGITTLFGKLKVKRNTTRLEIPLSLLGALLVFVTASDVLLDKQSFNIISRIDGIVLLSLAIIFLVYNLELAKKENDDVTVKIKERPILISVLWLLAGLAGLIIGGKLIVESATAISRAFGISERIIAITVISVGTSLPELATSLMAVKKGKVDLAIGNVVGSNIINVFLILGLSALIHPINVAINSFPDIYMNIAASLLLFLFLLFSKKRELGRWQGIIFLAIYIGYICFLLFPHNFKL